MEKRCLTSLHIPSKKKWSYFPEVAIIFTVYILLYNTAVTVATAQNRSIWMQVWVFCPPFSTVPFVKNSIQKELGPPVNQERFRVPGFCIAISAECRQKYVERCVSLSDNIWKFASYMESPFSICGNFTCFSNTAVKLLDWTDFFISFELLPLHLDQWYCIILFAYD